MLTNIFLSVLAVSSVNAASVKRAVNPGFDVQKVRQQMIGLAAHSWEWGTAAEALLELDSPGLSVFGANPFPVPNNPSSSALDYARGKIFTGGQYLVPNDGGFYRSKICFFLFFLFRWGTDESAGAVGDPASLGVSALLIGKTDPVFLAAAERQKDYLFRAPKWQNGAISHRIEVPELW